MLYGSGIVGHGSQIVTHDARAMSHGSWIVCHDLQSIKHVKKETCIDRESWAMSPKSLPMAALD
jgi:hypothetical protein